MKEQNEELLEAALKLADLVKDLKAKGEIFFEAVELIQTIEAHRPQPEKVGGWVNVYFDGKCGGVIFSSEKEAKECCTCPHGRQVYVSEVVPVKWKPWTDKSVKSASFTWQAIADAHNAEMERISK